VPPEVARQWQARYTHKGKPIHRAALLNQSDYEIVTKFNVECQGLLNYYILAQNVHKRLSVVRYICWQSLAKTLAAKHKKKSTWVYRRYISKLENGRKVIRVVIPREKPKKPLVATFGAKPIRYVKTAIINDEIPRPFYKKTELVQRLLADQCELCHSTEDIEVHHVHKLANIRRKYKGRKQPPQWAVFMMSRNRKTVVVCRECHYKTVTAKETYTNCK
jgi:hypothetical protein